MDYKKDSKNILSFFKKLLLIIFIIFVLDFALGWLIRQLYYKQQSGLLYRTTYSLEKSNEDIIILGPSTANHHYIPSIFEDSLNLTCYNTGKDGQGLFYCLAIQRAILQRYTPKIFLLDIRPSMLSHDFNDIARLSGLLPYYRNHKEIRSIIERKSFFEKFKLISNTYPFNSSLLTMLGGYFQYNKEIKKDFNGFIPLYGTDSNIILLDTVRLNYKFSEEKINCLKEMIKNAEVFGSKFIIIDSPSYKFYQDEEYYAIIDNLKNSTNILYWNYLNDSLFYSKPNLFKDRGHLNNNGASLFTKEIVSRLKEALFKNYKK